MAGTVDALAYKADVKSRAKESVSGRIDDFKSRVTGAASQVSEATPDAGDVQQGAKRAVGVAQENPLGLVVGSVAVGFLAGMLIPSTKVEDERVGPIADQVKEQARQTGQEALDHGKQIAQETAQTAMDSAKEAAQEVKQSAQQSAAEHGERVTASVQESAEKVQQTATQD
jgi:gas vesicle protein